MDPYATHIEFIKEIYSVIDKPKNVIEFGCGNYSTEFLIENSENVISIEMQSEDWFNEIKAKLNHNLNWKIYSLIGPMTFLNIELPDIIDLAFVDGHGESRPECINHMMKKKCPIIIAHDTEERGYGWDRVLSNHYHKFEFKKYNNWSTLWTTNTELYNFLSLK